VKTGVQGIHDPLKKLDSGVCPGLDPGFAGMTGTSISDFYEIIHFGC